MKRKIITILLGLLSISIGGIITVQLIWINNAIRVKEELFTRNASEALQKTVMRLENLHDVMIINRMAFPDSALWLNRSRMLPPAPPQIGNKNPGQRFVFSSNSHPGQNIRIETDSDSLTHFNYEIITNGNNPQSDFKTEVRKQEDVIVMRKRTTGSFDSLMKTSLERLDSLSGVFDTIMIRQQTTPQIHVRASNLRNITQKAVSEIIALDKPDIDPQNLESILAEELLNRNIPIPFQFGVLRDSTLLLASEVVDTTVLLNSSLKTELFPGSLFRRNQQLSLFFPDRDVFIYRSMSWLLAASFFFSAIMLVTFAMSVLFLLRQKKISEMKSDFINNMTHEFKTPIATIAVASDSLFNDKVLADPDMIKYFSGMIKKENQRMNRQVEDILTIARLEKKELEFKWETFNIHEVLNEVIESFRVQVEQREGKILSVFEATRPLVVSDKKHLSHAVFNLLDNANKYTEDTPRIIVRTSDTEGGVILSVTDNGIGMTRQVQTKIFERFYRQPSGNIHNVKGFGLGLSYTRAVVEAGKGNIRVKSEPGKGSSFEIFLPGNL
jgi:two-component system, OmpR family, phosphate regulon sensor histidine kinase PhoR